MTCEQVVLISTMFIMMLVIRADPDAFDSLSFQHGRPFLGLLLADAVGISYHIGLVYIVIQSITRNALQLR